MLTLAPNIDLVFTEAGAPEDRVRAAAEAGFDAVEMWMHTDKDLDALERATKETGVRIVAQLVEPRPQFLADSDETHAAFFEGLDRCLAVARRLDIPRLVIGGGPGVSRIKREPSTAAVIEVFSRVAERVAGSDVTVVIEAVNERVDHPGSFLSHTADSAAVARAVGSPQVGILYDLYHSVAQGEDIDRVIPEYADVIRYVQFADSPGRGEPGSGSIDWAHALGLLQGAGYDGPVGLEFYPQAESALAVRSIQEWVRA